MCAVLNIPLAQKVIDSMTYNEDDIVEFILADTWDLMHEKYLHVLAALHYVKNGEWDVTGEGEYYNQQKEFVANWKQGCNAFIDDLDDHLHKLVEEDLIKSGWEKNEDQIEGDEVENKMTFGHNCSTPPLMQILGSIKRRECEIVRACRKGPPFPRQIPEQNLFILQKPHDYMNNLYEKIHFKYGVKGAPLKTPTKNNLNLDCEDSTKWELHEWESQDIPIMW